MGLKASLSYLCFHFAAQREQIAKRLSHLEALKQNKSGNVDVSEIVRNLKSEFSTAGEF